jgi:hypothetical protein
MIPAESVIRIQLQEVAQQEEAALQISETSFTAGGAPPYAFELEYFPAQISPQGRYALRATITHEDRLIFASDTHIPAFQDGPVDIVVKRVRMPRLGRIVLFHNCYPDSTKRHDKSLHGGMPLDKGEKWACNFWFRENRFQTEPQQDPFRPSETTRRF